MARKEFLAFLASAATQAGPGARHHLLLTPPDESIRSMIDKWNSSSLEMRLVDSRTETALHELVKQWFSERSKAPRTEIALDELPHLRRAVDRWSERRRDTSLPFAWVNPRNS